MSLAWSILAASWQVLVWMAPYLLLGFLLAGILSVVLSPDWVRRHMAGRGVWQVVKAALVGVPLPLCSCSVIPVALSLRQQYRLGRLGTVLYLVAICSTAVLTGWLLDCFFPAALAQVPPLSAHCADGSPASWWAVACALALLLLMAPGLRLWRKAG